MRNIIIGIDSFDPSFLGVYRHIGLVVKPSVSRAADLGFDSRFLHVDFSGLSHTSDLRIGTPVAGYLAKCLALYGQRLDCLAWCLYSDW